MRTRVFMTHKCICLRVSADGGFFARIRMFIISYAIRKINHYFVKSNKNK